MYLNGNDQSLHKTNPDNFVADRLAMILLSQIAGVQTAAYLLTGEDKYARAVGEHLEDWFSDFVEWLTTHCY
ncbi:MAG: alginate lyase family protein [Balneolaceae bacterium]